MGYDEFEDKPIKYKQSIAYESRNYAIKMNAPLIYCSVETYQNLEEVWKLIICRIFNVDPKIKIVSDADKHPIFELEPTCSSICHDDILTGLRITFDEDDQHQGRLCL